MQVCQRRKCSKCTIGEAYLLNPRPSLVVLFAIYAFLLQLTVLNACFNNVFNQINHLSSFLKKNFPEREGRLNHVLKLSAIYGFWSADLFVELEQVPHNRSRRVWRVTIVTPRALVPRMNVSSPPIQGPHARPACPACPCTTPSPPNTHMRCQTLFPVLRLFQNFSWELSNVKEWFPKKIRIFRHHLLFFSYLN